MVEIKRYEASDAGIWNEFLFKCRNATFLHNRNYMDYHSNRFNDCSLMAFHDGRLMAVLPANATDGVLYSHQGLTYGGWLMSLKHFDASLMLSIMDAACTWSKAQGFSKWVYKPVPHIYHSYPAEEDLYALFRHGAMLVESNISSSVMLNCPLAFDRGNKSAMNVARKAGIEVGESDDWTAYWQVLEAVLLEHHGVRPVHTVPEIKLLHDRFPGNIRLYTASAGKDVVAGVVMFYTATVAHAQYIASSATGREVKALPLLFDFLIGKAQEAGCSYFDFGISNEEHGQVLNCGLVQQKSRMGGRGIVYNTYKIDL